jgi:hypothetical protein
VPWYWLDGLARSQFATDQLLELLIVSYDELPAAARLCWEIKSPSRSRAQPDVSTADRIRTAAILGAAIVANPFSSVCLGRAVI